MASTTIDVKKLSKEEQFQIVPIQDQVISLEYIEKLIDQDFDRYDEVFRKLA